MMAFCIVDNYVLLILLLYYKSMNRVNNIVEPSRAHLILQMEGLFQSRITLLWS